MESWIFLQSGRTVCSFAPLWPVMDWGQMKNGVIKILIVMHDRTTRINFLLTYISDTVSRENFFVHPEDVSSWKPVGPPGPRQVSDEGVLWIGLVLVSVRSVAPVETDISWYTSLSKSRVTPGFCVGRPTQPVVVEHHVRPHLVGHHNGLERVGLKRTISVATLSRKINSKILQESKTGFFHRFSLNSRGSKLKIFSKLNNFLLNSSKFSF